ncbi:kinase-like domain-containing protein [Rhizophagus clarus]|uniref:Kinase-like domain-containing protein n=1 Tax=Rhizophagus clarus TaxID=94130 RepID=A0A8H3R2J9_9GLOM|nr:kinase-like domain-containing protein [Rhizophagus clarus]
MDFFKLIEPSVANEICKKCNHICYAMRFQQKFINWTSGNNYIDKFIQDTQLSAHDDVKEALEWIPYDRLYNIKYITKNEFGKVYRANWIDGNININYSILRFGNKNDKSYWNDKNQNWKRESTSNMFVNLKNLNIPNNLTLEFTNEIKVEHIFYGITQDPETKNYMMVLNNKCKRCDRICNSIHLQHKFIDWTSEYAEGGSLRNHLDKEYSKLNWDIKIGFLQDAISGLKCVHEKGLIHRDLHSGNILKVKYNAVITDMGLCKPENHIAVENAKSYVYGLRPRYNIKVPQLIVDLIKRCLDSDPLNRPKAEEIETILCAWLSKPNDNQTIELQAQIKAADEINNNLIKRSVPSTSLGSFYVTYSEAIYTSRLLSFNNLPEPKNSDDYYEQNDNIISKEFSDSLQIDISQLNINLKFLFVRPIISDVHFVLPMV